jgi:anti-sigma factor RsiW
MNCSEAKGRLHLYVEGELPLTEMEELREHIMSCGECSSAALAWMEEKRAVRVAGTRYAASTALRERVRASVRGQNPTAVAAKSVASQARKQNLVLWPRWAMAAAALLLLVGALYLFANRYQRTNSLGEFADLHVVALSSSNPVEVVSTDRHTVKPWFQGKIPFTFDLPDLQGTPFTLVGGRVAYYHQEPGAQLIFSYQKHYISAFILRDTPQLSITQPSFADRGTSFNLQTWQRNGLRYVLVSDVNAGVVQQLAQLLQQNRDGGF